MLFTRMNSSKEIYKRKRDFTQKDYESVLYIAKRAIMQESDDSRGLNKLHRSAAADKEFLRLLIAQEKKEPSLVLGPSLSHNSLHLLINQEDDYSHRKKGRQRFLRSYRLAAEEKNKNWLQKKQASMELYNSVNKATACYKFRCVINTAVFCSCSYMAKQYRYITRIVRRKV